MFLSCLVTFLCVYTGVLATPIHSQLWGENGELFDPLTSRLIDFSFAGYRGYDDAHVDLNERIQLPVVAAIEAGKNGVAGDGDSDDSGHFQDAIDNLPIGGGVISVGPGRYRLDTPLLVEEVSHLILRGAGSDQTTFVLPDPVSSSYKGYIQAHGKTIGDELLATVEEDAPRGSHVLQVSFENGVTVAVGDFIHLQMNEDGDPSFIELLCAGNPGDGCDYGELGGRDFLFDMVSRVDAVDGNSITLQRALPLPLRTSYKPILLNFAPDTYELGFEGFTLEFPNVERAKHLDEPGYFGFSFRRAVDVWGDDIVIINADSGIRLDSQSMFSTWNNVRFEHTEGRLREKDGYMMSGHHGFVVSKGQDHLAMNFYFNTYFVHDVSQDWFSARNVWMQGGGLDVNFDHHRSGVYQNLMTANSCGACLRPFESSGASNRGPQGNLLTFWYLETNVDIELKPVQHDNNKVFLNSNYVGIRSKNDTQLPNDRDGSWVEITSADDIALFEPKNLFLAQRAKRFGMQPPMTTVAASTTTALASPSSTITAMSAVTSTVLSTSTATTTSSSGGDATVTSYSAADTDAPASSLPPSQSTSTTLSTMSNGQQPTAGTGTGAQGATSTTSLSDSSDSCASLASCGVCAANAECSYCEHSANCLERLSAAAAACLSLVRSVEFCETPVGAACVGAECADGLSCVDGFCAQLDGGTAGNDDGFLLWVIIAAVGGCCVLFCFVAIILVVLRGRTRGSIVNPPLSRVDDSADRTYTELPIVARTRRSSGYPGRYSHRSARSARSSARLGVPLRRPLPPGAPPPQRTAIYDRFREYGS